MWIKRRESESNACYHCSVMHNYVTKIMGKQGWEVESNGKKEERVCDVKGHVRLSRC